jgi:peptidoglycan biosynthesis protein MviN/MurJ (putative lipid II flippase)
MPARQIIFWSIPVIVFFVVLRAHIVRVILGSGEFTWSDTRLTAASLALFAVSVVFQSMTLLLVRAYYAAGKTWRPFWITTIGGVISVGSGYLFLFLFNDIPRFRNFIESIMRVSDVPGTSVLMLALAYTLGQTIVFVMLWLFFRFEFMRYYKTGLRKVVGETLLGSIVMGVVIYQALRLFDNILDINTFWGVLGQAVLSGVLGIIAFVMVLRFVGNEEIKAIRRLLARGRFRVQKIFGADTEDISHG